MSMYLCLVKDEYMILSFLVAFRADLSADKNKKKKRELNDEQKNEIKEAFELFDTDKDKEIDYHELKVISSVD